MHDNVPESAKILVDPQVNLTRVINRYMSLGFDLLSVVAYTPIHSKLVVEEFKNDYGIDLKEFKGRIIQTKHITDRIWDEAKI